jgi:twitching motility protein PilT
MSFVNELLEEVIERDGSDLHLIGGDPPRMRLYGDLITMREEPLKPSALRDALSEIIPPAATEMLAAKDQADFAYAVDGLARFRVNAFRHLGGMGAIMRSIPSTPKSLEELRLPEVIGKLCKQSSGLILVTGKTGSGKSTTLAAMVDDINRRLKGHILTIEDPIEFVHQRRNCLISQREIGLHSPSFADALHSAMREDPDVILVGELRDLETMSTAITAAEMGILVMGTLHTNGAIQTVDRIVNAFAAEKQSHVRTMLSTSLQGVISQQLCRKKTGGGSNGQHRGGQQPAPAGKTGSDRERDAGRREGGDAHHGQRAPGPGGHPFHIRSRGLREGHLKGALQALRRPAGSLIPTPLFARVAVR